MARTKKVDVSNSGEFKHRSYVSENGETLYDAPIEIKDRADMENYGINVEECKYLHLGSSQRILVYFYKTTNRAFAEYQWEHINNMHSSGYYSTRCMVPGQRKVFIRCKDTNKCSACPYGRTPDTKQAAIISLDGLVEDGYEPETCGFVEQQAMAKMEYAELRARMDAEDPRIARAFEAKELLGDSVTRIAADFGISEPRVYQLIARAKAIGKDFSER